MNNTILIWVILAFVVGPLSCASTTTRKANPNKNTTSNAVTVAGIVLPSTTQKPLLQGVRLPCSCLQGQCGCCTGFILERFKQKACMNITYEPDDFAFTAAMSLNERVLYKNTVSGKNPPPVCLSIPRIPFIDLCVEFSNIYFANRNMHLCVGMEANWNDFTLLDLSFNCVRMGANGLAVIGPEEGGGLPINPIDEEAQINEDYDDSARDAQLLNPKLQNKHATKSTLTSNSSNSTKLPISVKRLSSGDFLIIVKDSSKIQN